MKDCEMFVVDGVASRVAKSIVYVLVQVRFPSLFLLSPASNIDWFKLVFEEEGEKVDRKLN